MASNNSIHQFSIKGLSGGTVDFGAFRGKKVLVANTASECGLTPQYQQLQELHQELGDKLVVVGIPCNDFGGQEPGDASTIATFCERNFGVTFPLTEKLSTKAPQHPIFQFLTSKELNGLQDDEIQWNFHKFLLDEEGRLIASFPPPANPAEAVLQYI
ncbi:glutathione peroxidase [soil metagenome]